MKTRIIFFTLSAATALPAIAQPPVASTAIPASATSPSPAAPAVAAQSRLTLVVTVPPSMHPFRDDDIAVAFGDDLRSEFRREGYRGPIDFDTKAPDRARTEKPRLELNLVAWGVSPGRVIEFTFTANLVTPQGTEDLGLFSGSSLIMAGLRDPFTRADGFDEAARDAIGDLQRTLTERNLLQFTVHS